jgi:hypothetical protein
MEHDMTLDLGMSILVRGWLHETTDELPDDPALFAGIKTNLRAPRPQPWTQLFRQGTPRAIAVSLVATLAIVLVGLAFGMPSPDGRAPAVGAGPSPSPIPPPLPAGSIPPGRYSFPRAAVPLVGNYGVSLDVPAGWSNDSGGWVLTMEDGDPPAGATVEVDAIRSIIVDPCDALGPQVDVPSDSSLESVAALLASWGSDTGGRTATSPTTTAATFGTFDGRPGVEVTVLMPEGVVQATCTEGHYTLWSDGTGGRYVQGAGEQMRVRVVQVGSEFLFLAAGSFRWTPADILAEQQAMLDSVRIFSRPAPPSSPASPTH